MKEHKKKKWKNAIDIKKLTRLWQYKEIKVKARSNQYQQYWIIEGKKN